MSCISILFLSSVLLPALIAVPLLAILPRVSDLSILPISLSIFLKSFWLSIIIDLSVMTAIIILKRISLFNLIIVRSLSLMLSLLLLSSLKIIPWLLSLECMVSNPILCIVSLRKILLFLLILLKAKLWISSKTEKLLL